VVGDRVSANRQGQPGRAASPPHPEFGYHLEVATAGSRFDSLAINPVAGYTNHDRRFGSNQ
jgi:hypothetical protein